MSQSLNYRRTLATLPLLAALAVPTVGLTQNQSAEWGSITPSHVYQVTEQIIEEVDILRDAIGVMDIPVYPEPQNSRTPVHSYAKALEVMEKISRAERKLGMAPVEVEQLPIKVINLQTRLGMDPSNVPNVLLIRVTPSDTYDIANTILAELNRIKVELEINLPHETRRLPTGKRANDTFAQMRLIGSNLDVLLKST